MRRSHWVPLVLTMLVASLYLPSLSSSFHFDDFPNIVRNAHFRLLNSSIASFYKAAFASPSANRPIPNLTFAAHYLFTHTPSAASFRFVNIMVHLAGAIVLWRFLRLTFSLPAVRPLFDGMPIGAEGAAAVGALLWAVHPVQTEAVTYIVQRMTSLAALFYLLSLFYFARRRRGDLLLSAIFGSAAFLTKENTATLPAVMAGYELLFLAPQPLPRRRIAASLVVATVVMAAVALFYLTRLPLSAGPAERGVEFDPAPQFLLSRYEKGLTEIKLFFHYLSLLLFPHPSRLLFDYSAYPPSRALAEPAAFLSLTGLILYLAIGVFLLRSRPLIGFFLLWIPLHLVIESFPLLNLEVAYEHRLYLPSVGAAALAGIAAVRFARSKRAFALSAAACGVALALASAWTVQRNSIWETEETLWGDVISKAPNNARGHNNLAAAYLRQNRLEEAERELRVALSLRPKYAEAHKNLGVVYKAQNRIDEAVAQFETAVRLAPYSANAHEHYGNILRISGKIDPALSEYLQALTLGAPQPETLNNLGLLYYLKGNREQAAAAFRGALRLDPSFQAAKQNLKVVLDASGTESIQSPHVQ